MLIGAGDGGLDARLSREIAHVAALRIEHQGDDGAFGACTGGAARAVRVGLVLHRRVGVDDQADIVDVDATRSDVGGHQRLGGARVERGHRALTRVLAHVSLQFDGGNAGGVELLGELLRAVLGAGEDHGAAGRGDQIDEDWQVRVARDVQHVVLERRHDRLRGVRLVHRRLVHVALDEGVDLLVERGGEQHALPALGGLIHQATHRREEAHVGHVIGLVENGDLDGGQRGEALPDEILQAAGARHEDVDALGERGHLRLLVHAAEHGAGGESGGRGQRREGFVDLEGELAGRREDQRTRTLGCAAGAGGDEAGHHRQQERVRLAGAGAAAPQNVASAERIGQRGRLDGGRGGDAARREDVDKVGGHAERAEGR